MIMPPLALVVSPSGTGANRQARSMSGCGGSVTGGWSGEQTGLPSQIAATARIYGGIM